MKRNLAQGQAVIDKINKEARSERALSPDTINEFMNEQKFHRGLRKPSYRANKGYK